MCLVGPASGPVDTVTGPAAASEDAPEDEPEAHRGADTQDQAVGAARFLLCDDDDDDDDDEDDADD